MNEADEGTDPVVFNLIAAEAEGEIFEKSPPFNTVNSAEPVIFNPLLSNRSRTIPTKDTLPLFAVNPQVSLPPLIVVTVPWLRAAPLHVSAGPETSKVPPFPRIELPLESLKVPPPEIFK